MRAQPVNELERMNMAKLRTHEHIVGEKEAEIRRGNQKLLDRLVEISSGKFVVPCVCVITVGCATSDRRSERSEKFELYETQEGHPENRAREYRLCTKID